MWFDKTSFLTSWSLARALNFLPISYQSSKVNMDSKKIKSHRKSNLANSVAIKLELPILWGRVAQYESQNVYNIDKITFFYCTTLNKIIAQCQNECLKLKLKFFLQPMHMVMIEDNIFLWNMLWNLEHSIKKTAANLDFIIKIIKKLSG